MAAPPTGPPAPKEAVDRLRFDDINSTKSKQFLFALQQFVQPGSDKTNEEFAEEFLELGGLDALITALKHGSGTVQGLILQVMNKLLMYVNAMDQFNESPDLVDRVYTLLIPVEGEPLNLTVAKSTLDLLIAICGVLENGHALVNSAAERKIGADHQAYAALIPLLSSGDLMCVHKALLFMNVLMSKRKAIGDVEAKELLFQWKQTNVLSLLRPLTSIDDQTIRQQLANFQKLTGFTVPRSWEEAHKYKALYEESKKRYEKANETLFVFQQQQAKMRLMKLEYQRAQETLKTLGKLLPHQSTMAHPTRRFEDGGGISVTALLNPAIESTEVAADDGRALSQIRKDILERFLGAPDMALLAQKMLGLSDKKKRGGAAQHADPSLRFFDDDDLPPPPTDSDDEGSEPPPPASEGSEPPPPFTDSDADEPPAFSDDDDAPPGGNNKAATRGPKATAGHAGADAGAGADGAVAAGSGGGAVVAGVSADGVRTAAEIDAVPAGSSGAAAAPVTPQPPQSTPTPTPTTFGEAQVDSSVKIPPPTGKAPPPPLPPGKKGVPPPPPPPPFGKKGPLPPFPGKKAPGGPPGKGPAAPVRQWPGPTPSKKMKPLHWEKMKLSKEAEENSLWGKISSGEVKHEFDHEEFEAMFSQKEVDKKPKKPAAPKKVMLIEGQPLMNLSIMLHRLPTIPNIQRALLELDDSTLTPSMLLAMTDTRLINPEVQKEFRTNQGKKPVEEYEPPEQFLAMIETVPAFRQRCLAWLTTCDFTQDVDDVSKPLAKLHDTIKSVLASQHLPYFFGLLLAFGNMMNHGNAMRGNAFAVSLSTLSKCDALKDNSGKTSLLQHMLVTAKKRNPDALMSLGDELKMIMDKAARRLDIEEMEKSVNGASGALEKFKTTVTTVKKKMVEAGMEEGDPFGPRMAVFSTEAAEKMALLDTKFKACKASYAELMQFLGFEGKTVPVGDVFNELAQFATKVQAAAAEAARDRKRLARKGQRIGDGDLANVVGKLQDELAA